MAACVSHHHRLDYSVSYNIKCSWRHCSAAAGFTYVVQICRGVGVLSVKALTPQTILHGRVGVVLLPHMDCIIDRYSILSIRIHVESSLWCVWPGSHGSLLYH